MKNNTSKSFGERLVRWFLNVKIDNLFFEIGVFLLPFENFVFAPSSGWASISPIIFAIYAFLKIKRLPKFVKKYGKFLGIFCLFITWGLFRALMCSSDLNNIINSLISIALGLVVLYSIDCYYEENKKFTSVVKLILVSYYICLAIGILEWIAIIFDISSLRSFFEVVFKRNYLRMNRIQYFFTEPSFIGMHLFGVLLPIYLITREKSLLVLIFIFAISAVIFPSGVRIIIDIAAVIGIFLVYYVLLTKKAKLLIIIPLLGALIIGIVVDNNYRMRTILDDGVYSDGSLASRWFRINSSLKGYMSNSTNAFLGYGIGNSLAPLREGYDKAVAEYKSNYMKEVEELGDPEFNDDSVSYCLYIRLISEYGIIGCLVISICLMRVLKNSKFKYKYPLFVTVLYLYIQFESFAFYSLWILIAILINTQKNALTLDKKEGSRNAKMI